MNGEKVEQIRVVVSFARPEAMPAEPSLELVALLSDAERGRWARFRSQDSRRQYLAAHALLRTSLSSATPGAPPAEWRFEPGPHGKPQLCGPTGFPLLCFNLSHTAGLVACAVAVDRSLSLGIDVERLDREFTIDAIDRVAQRIFSDRERQALTASEGAAKRHRFLATWTLKEAYGKARGAGLSLPLKAITFHGAALEQTDPSRSPVAVSFGGELADDPGRWIFRLYRPTLHHLLAVAVGPLDPHEPPGRIEIELLEAKLI